MIAATHAYDDAVFDEEAAVAGASACVVVPLVMALAPVDRVVDVGCGRGAWLRAFVDAGVSRVLGIDNPWRDVSKLMIDPACFRAADLRRPFTIDGRFDLAVCLEVAEHLPADRAPALIAALTAAAPLVLFSAAIPRQGGVGHVNEQWPSYWRAFFGEHGFQRIDCLRRQMWQDSRIGWWYRQNMFLFASEQGVENCPALRAELDRHESPEIEWIHESILARVLARDDG